MGLSEKKCVPCQIGTPPLNKEQIEKLHTELTPGWSVQELHHLQKEYPFPNFKKALEFTNKIGEVAEQEGHHPDIYLAWGKVKVTIWTHKVNGLTENDFILASKIDTILT